MAAQEPRISVRLLIYSGRRDPEWALDGNAVAKLTERVRKTLAGERIHPPPTGALGYKGFLVKNGARAPELPAEFQVYYGVLTEREDSRSAHWRDSGGVEEFLLAEARQQGFDKPLDTLGVGPKGGP